MCKLMPDFPAHIFIQKSEVKVSKQLSTTQFDVEVDSVIRFLKSHPPAVAGNGGNIHTFSLAARLTRDWRLPSDLALKLLLEHWNPRCEPPWTENELDLFFKNADKYGTGPFEDEWQPLIPLDEFDLPSPPSNIFPPGIEEFLKQLSDSSETPYDLTFLLFLGIVSVAVAGKYEIAVSEIFSEPCSIWALIVLEPGNRKSFVFSRLSKIISSIESELQKSKIDEVKKNEANIKSIDAKISALRRKLSKDENSCDANLMQEIEQLELSKPKKIHLPRLRVGDITTEKLGEIMKENQEVIALLSDEGGFLQNIGGRYSNNIPNFDLFLQSYTRSTVRVDRKNLNEPIQLEAPCLTIGATIQPIVLEQLSSRPEFKNIGLLSRFLFCVPKSNLGFRLGERKPVSLDLVTEYEKLISTIFHASSFGGIF